MDPLAFTPDELEELLADACRKAYRKGVKAATRKFDTLLSRHYRRHQLESLNGTTGEFVEEARQELKSLTILKRRDATGHDHAADGKFAPKGGGGDKATGSDHKPDSGASGPTNSNNSQGKVQSDHIPEEHLLDGLHEVVPAGQWHRVKAAVTRAGQKVYERMVLATPAFLKLQHVLTAIEGPDDLKRFGYKPMFDGTAGHDTPDALKDATGVGGTLGAKLAAHVLTRVVFWMKRGLSAGEAVGKAMEELGIGKAFDPNEKRDASGKWTSGGGESHDVIDPSKATREEFEAAAIPPEKAADIIGGIRAGDERSKNKGERRSEGVRKPQVLVRFPISLIPPHVIEFVRESTNPDRVKNYAGQTIDTPVLLAPMRRNAGFGLSDGGHRLMAAIARGDTHINAFVPSDSYDLFRAASGVV